MRLYVLADECLVQAKSNYVSDLESVPDAGVRPNSNRIKALYYSMYTLKKVGQIIVREDLVSQM